MCYRLMKQGALDEDLYRGKAAYWLLLHSSPGRRAWWHRHSIMLSKEFVDEVSKELEKIPVKKLREAHPIFDSSSHARSEAGEA